MQKWPYAGITYLAVDHFPFAPQQNHPAQKREYLKVEVVLVSENTVMVGSQERVNYYQYFLTLLYYSHI